MAGWDPIGVNDTPDAADEYDGYIGGIYELIEGGASEAAISSHLREIEIDHMEMTDAAGLPLLPEFKRTAAAAALRSVAKLFKPPS